jgi:hypothetical protein
MVLTAPPDQCSEDPIMSMSTASIPVFEIGLNALSAILNKAEAYAEAKKIDPTVLPDTRLFPDMFAFTRQVRATRQRTAPHGSPASSRPSMRIVRRRSLSQRRGSPRRSPMWKR